MSDDDALFALQPSEFIAARDELARQLRADGDREGAQRVGKLRRPTVPAWAVNQVARQHPDELGRLIETGSELRLAQRRALSGARNAGLREATARRREGIDELTDTAARILADAGTNPDSHRAAISATLEAATVDEDAALQVRGGRLSKELPAPAGFGDLTGLMLVPDPETSTEEEDQTDEEEARLQAQRAEAERVAQLAQGRADEAEQQARAAEMAADEARRDAEAAIRQADRAQKAAERARRTADQQAAGAQQAREELAGLEP